MAKSFRAVLIQVEQHLRIASAGICQKCTRSIPMMDVVMVALAIGFFALSIAYVYACEQL